MQAQTALSTTSLRKPFSELHRMNEATVLKVADHLNESYIDSFLDRCTTVDEFSKLSLIRDGSIPPQERTRIFLDFLGTLFSQSNGAFLIPSQYEERPMAIFVMVVEMVKKYPFLFWNPRIAFLCIECICFLDEAMDEPKYGTDEKTIGLALRWTRGALHHMYPETSSLTENTDTGASQSDSSDDSTASKGQPVFDAEECACGIRLIRKAFSITDKKFKFTDRPDVSIEFFDIGEPVWRALLEMGGPSLSQFVVEKNMEEAWGMTGISVMRRKLSRHEQEDHEGGATDLSTSVSKLATAPSAKTTGPTHIVITDEIPPATEKDAIAELQRLSILQGPLPVAELPSVDAIDLMRTRLTEEFPWAHRAIDLVATEMRARRMFGATSFSGMPVLLVGPAGSGKSRLARRIAEETAMPFLYTPIPGSDSRALAGTTRGWSTAQASNILQFMVNRRTASLMLLADEIDKAGERLSNDPGPLPVLLGLLEKETAKRWADPFIMAPCDLSKVTIWATANSTAMLKKPLLSRFTVIEVPRPTREQLKGAIRGATRDIAEEWGIDDEVLPPVPDSIVCAHTDNLREVKKLVKAYLCDFAASNQKAFARQ